MISFHLGIVSYLYAKFLSARSYIIWYLPTDLPVQGRAVPLHHVYHRCVVVAAVARVHRLLLDALRMSKIV